jgi:hypothetical protein
MKSTILGFSLIIVCGMLFSACVSDQLTSITAVTYHSPTADDLSIVASDVHLRQRLYGSNPCVSEGWDVEIKLALSNRNPDGRLEGVRIWRAVVFLSDSVSFSMDLSSNWDGIIRAKMQDTVVFNSSVSRSCQDNDYSGKVLPMLLIWDYSKSPRRYFAIDSVKVHFIALPY